MPRAVRHALTAVLATALLGTSATAASAVTSSVEPTWSSSTDGGQLATDVVEFVRAATNPDRDNSRPVQINAGNNIYMAGTAYQNSAQDLRDDRDVLFSAYDAVTGEQVWSTRYDCGTARLTDTYLSSIDGDRGACLLPGTDEDLVAFDIDGNNNLGYATMNLVGAVRFQKIALGDGSIATGSFPGFEIPGAFASDTAIQWPGGNAVIAGMQDGGFWVTSRAIGNPTVDFDTTTVRGRANDVDIERSYFDDRTATATGIESVNFGDIHTANYRVRDGLYEQAGLRWSHTWTGPNGGKDEGIAVEQAHVDGLGWVSFVVGRSFSPATGWDLVVLAYDNTSGALLWEQVWANLPGEDDQPFDLHFNDANQTLVVAGTTERGVPHGEDIVVLSFDATDGTLLATAFASGDISNGDDAPSALELSPDGDRVFVLGHAHNFLHTGGRVNALFAFDADLHPAGTAVLNQSGTGLPLGGLAFTHGYQDTQDVVAGVKGAGLGGNFDQQATRLPLADFVVQTIATAIDFTSATAESVVAGDPATVQAALVDDTGQPIAGADVTLGLGPAATTVTTDTDGLATASFDTSGLYGTYALTADFAGDGVLLPSQAQSTIEVVRLATTLEFTDATTTQVDVGQPVDASVVLADVDGRPIADVPVTISFDGATRDAVTDVDGVASATFPTDDRYPGGYDLTAAFAGDDRHEASATATTVSIALDEPLFEVTSSGTRSGVTLTVAASNAAAETADATFDAAWFADERPGTGNGRAEAVAVRDLRLQVTELVDGQWVTVHVEARPQPVALDAADWSPQFEAIDHAGRYRVELTGTLVDADGADLPGRGVWVRVDLG